MSLESANEQPFGSLEKIVLTIFSTLCPASGGKKRGFCRLPRRVVTPGLARSPERAEKYNPCGSICAPKGLPLVSFFGSPMSSTQSPAEAELAELIISAVNLEGVAPADVDPEAPLFGAGLGLDSIDALELALEISKRYGFQLRSDDEENRRIFASLRSLSDYIQKNRTT
jgi:acyl carrier protein